MIAISNGWMDNTISYSRIASIATAAQEHTERANAGATVIDHSRDMGCGEKLFDYVFCGSVKQQLMDYLYQMAHDRTAQAISLRSRRALPGESADSSTAVNEARIHAAIRRKEILIKFLIKGNSLKFCPRSAEARAEQENYLIYKNEFTGQATGIPLKIPSRSRPMLRHVLSTSIPSFETVGDIQIRHLKATGKCRQLILAGQTYQVRFTKNNGPIVMLSDDVMQTDALQKRLHNIWSIDRVNRKLTGLMRRPLEDTRADASLTYSLHKNCTEQQLIANEKLGRLGDAIQVRYDEAVANLKSRLNEHGQLLRAELQRFENLTDPKPADARNFLRIQTRIKSFENSLDMANETIETCKYKLLNIYRTVCNKQIAEYLERRLLCFMDKMVAFDWANLKRETFREFIKGFYLQSQFVSYFDRDTVDSFINSPKIESADFQGMRPAVFDQQCEQLFSKIDWPNYTWDDVLKSRKSMLYERDFQIPAKVRQIKIGLRLNALLARTVPAGDGSSVAISQSNFSPDCNEGKNSMIKKRDQLLDPEQNFTLVDLVYLEGRIVNDVWYFERAYKEFISDTAAIPGTWPDISY